MANLKDMTLKEREKHLEEILAKKHDQKGTADKALTKVRSVNVPFGEQDEKHALVKALRGDKHDLDESIDKLRERLHAVRVKEAQRHHADGPAAAIKWLESQDGVTEMPAGSNWGEPVETWIKFIEGAGSGPVPWCGCFAGYGIVHVGGAAVSVLPRLGYGPDVIYDAQHNLNGLHAVPFSEIKGGELLAFWGGEHIGVARGPASGLTVPTVEGNTSPSSAGSQYNGGCVALKARGSSDVSVAARWW